jgi:hypothetical protein
MEPWMVVVGVQVIMTAAAWGDLKRQVAENARTQEERHSENREILKDLRDNLRLINITVARHDEAIEALKRAPK